MARTFGLQAERLESRQLLCTTGLITGKVFLDNNVNGVFDQGDEPQSRWVVWQDANVNTRREATEPFDRTDADGNYEVCLGPGNSMVRRAYTSAYDAITPEISFEPIHGLNSTVNFAMGDLSVLGVPVTGSVFVDQNRNDVRDNGEPGLARRAIWLDLDRNRKRDAGEPFTRTDSNGDFSLTVQPGSYQLRAAGVPLSADPYYVGTNFLDERYAQAVEFNVDTEDLGLHFDFANFSYPAGSQIVEGHVYFDIDQDGRRDDSQFFRYPGVRNRVVWLDLDADGKRDAGEPFDRTDADGVYRIFGVDPGSYLIRIAGGGDWVNTSPQSATVEVGTAMDEPIDFGLYSSTQGPHWRIDGRVHGDSINEWIAFADLDLDGVRDPAEPFGETNEEGRFRIDDVPAGSLILLEQREGFTQLDPIEGGYRAYYDRQFMAFRVRDSIEYTGVVFRDDNANGIRDAGEPGLDGYQLVIDGYFLHRADRAPVPSLWGRRGDLEDWNGPSTITNSDGSYRLTIDEYLGYHAFFIYAFPPNASTNSTPAASLSSSYAIPRAGFDIPFVPVMATATGEMTLHIESYHGAESPAGRLRLDEDNQVKIVNRISSPSDGRTMWIWTASPQGVTLQNVATGDYLTSFGPTDVGMANDLTSAAYWIPRRGRLQSVETGGYLRDAPSLDDPFPSHFNRYWTSPGYDGHPLHH